MSLEKGRIAELEQKYGLVFSLLVGSHSRAAYRQRWREYVSSLPPEMMEWTLPDNTNLIVEVLEELDADGERPVRAFMEVVVSHPNVRICRALCDRFLLPEDLLMMILIRPGLMEEDKETIFARQVELGLSPERVAHLISESRMVNLIISIGW